MTIIVQVWLNPAFEAPSRAGRFQVIETKAASFDDFCAMVTDDVLIQGDQLQTRVAGENRAEIYRRHPIAFRGSAVARCQPNTMECVEAIQ